MPDKEKIINILNNVINDFSSKWKSHDEKNNGVSDYADKITKLFEESYPAFSPDMLDKKLTPMMELCDMLAIQNPLRNQMIEKERQMVIDAAVFMATPIIGEVDEEYKKNAITVAEQYYTQTYKS